MTLTSEPPAFESGPAALAEAIARLPAEDAVSLPLLGGDTVQGLLDESSTLTYRPATPVIGAGERRVWQDCEVSCAVPREGALGACARRLQDAFHEAFALLSPTPLAERFDINDLIVQRYPKGSGGITPHRDHIAYRGLISVITLSGICRFAVCRDRSAAEARPVPAPVGWLVLMRGPGLYGLEDRPFHFVDRFTEPRISVGFRHDRRAPDGSVATLGLSPGG
ncbi:hypothetical protein HBA54_16050 [Pelagibius litoralis]|uniref:Fe2OG dioxygenase domain-containing protein n=1 Tax=Pelagibius litoralis TaxID=374515 RepID=A0A967EZ99_9PROT|nr:hypothetical protein [Pelagibius litoralis]NIA70119.1 hypothetical protein [Pelagibius litoralis]